MNNLENNLQTVVYTISEPGFKYHIVKGKFEKGSTISKKTHPIKYVEILKKELLDSKKLIDKGAHYQLKESIKIGALMAYNLHYGVLKKEFTNPRNIVINSNSDTNLKEEFDLKNIYSTDAILKRTFDMNSLKIEKVYNYKIEKEFLEGNNPNEFSKTEQLVFDILKREKQIINGRHGNANNKEADIVDDTLGIQIEVVTAFKAGIKDKLRQKHDTFLLLELIDTNLTNVSKALNKKFYEKDYSEKYKKELAIFCFGDTKNTKVLLEKLREILEVKDNIKNDFTQIHIIMYDFLFDKIYYVSNNISNSYSDKEFNIKFLDKQEIKFEDIKDDEEYIFITTSIFKNEKGISVQNGSDFKAFAQNMKMIND